MKNNTINIDEVISRVKSLKGLKSNKELALLFHLSPEDFSNRKRRGSLLTLIIEWAMNENVNINRILKGEMGIDQQSSVNCDDLYVLTHRTTSDRGIAAQAMIVDLLSYTFINDWLLLSEVTKMRVWTLVKEQIEKQRMSKENCPEKVESIFSEKEVDGSIKWDF